MARKQPQADLVAGLFGARGSGKSFTVRAYLEAHRPPRLLIVDPMSDYRGLAEEVPSLAAMAAASKGARFALRYVPVLPQKPAELGARFGAFCALAYRRGNLVMVVEEAQLFTRAQAAPPDWAHCTLRGRHVGLRIFAVSQRPAHMDKDFFTNATSLRTGRLNFDDDVGCMARALRVPRAAVAGLLGREWIARDMLTGDLTCDPGDAVARVLPSTMAERQAWRAPLKKSLKNKIR